MKRLEPIKAELLGSAFFINSEMYNVLEALDNTENITSFLNILLLDEEKNKVKIENVVMEKMKEHSVEEIDKASEVFVNYIVKELFGEKEEHNKHEQSMCLQQDAGLIKAGFVQVYKIDLDKEELDYRVFIDRLTSMVGTQLNNVIEIRTKPFEKGKGMEEHNRKLAEAKERVKIKTSKELQQEKEDEEILHSLFGGGK